MKNLIAIISATLSVCLLAISSNRLCAQTLTQKERIQWFEEARMGIMIHWSLCTPAAGRFNGEPLRQTRQSEWIRYYNKVQKSDWDELAKRMPITEEAIDEWVRLTKEGGFKYLTFVSKHHDGVAF